LHNSGLAIGLRKIGLVLLQAHFLMLGGSLGSKSSIENSKAINMQNLELTQEFRNLQNEKPFSGLLSVQSVSPLRSTYAF